ncbi:MAG: hypothetical protein U1A72_23375 [Sulfuritalea sp.]|nr:hypothetical protein [Sulfuritalea sp.]
MNSHTAPHGLILHIPRAARRPATVRRAPARTTTPASWMERLAAWAERQPVHHRVGSWERFR